MQTTITGIHGFSGYARKNRPVRWHCRSSRGKTTLVPEILPWSLGEIELGGDDLKIGPSPVLTTDWLRHGAAASPVSSSIRTSLATRVAQQTSEHSGKPCTVCFYVCPLASRFYFGACDFMRGGNR